jgi:hypothetical protein
MKRIIRIVTSAAAGLAIITPVANGGAHPSSAAVAGECYRKITPEGAYWCCIDRATGREGCVEEIE